MSADHRVFLECCWETIERAGYDPMEYSGRVGVFAGCGANSYLLNNLYANRDLVESVDGDLDIRYQLTGGPIDVVLVVGPSAGL